jgi:hypothetical protein
VKEGREGCGRQWELGIYEQQGSERPLIDRQKAVAKGQKTRLESCGLMAGGGPNSNYSHN